MLWNRMNDMDEEYGHIPDGFLLNPEEVEELRKSKKELTEYGKKKLRKLKMNNIAQKCVAAARNVAEGSPTLGKLIREGKNPMITKTYYEYAAVIREAVNEFQYYNFENGEDMIIDARDLYDLADALEAL
jgi:hypothetical protein